MPTGLQKQGDLPNYQKAILKPFLTEVIKKTKGVFYVLIIFNYYHHTSNPMIQNVFESEIYFYENLYSFQNKVSIILDTVTL